MASTAAVLNIVVKANTTSAVSGLRKVDTVTRRTARSADTASKHAEKHGRALRTIGHGAAYALGAGGFGGGMYALFDITRKSISAFKESERVTRQTAAAIHSTGGAAHVSAKYVQEFANRLAEKTGIDDEAIQTSQNLLLTFTNVRNEAGKGNKIFDQSTKAIVDMATAMNHGATPSTADLHAATLQLGKALQDPVKGAGALRRVGVQLDAQQQKNIKTMVKHGNTMGAQKIILRELNREFGGSAAKQATAGKRLSVTLGNLAEAIGRALNPSLQKGAARLEKFINEMLKGTGEGGKFVKTLQGIWEAVKPTLVVVGRLALAMGRFAASHPGLAKVAVEMGLIWTVAKKFRGFSIVQAISGGMGSAGGKKMVGGRLTALLAGLRSVAVRGGWTLLGASILQGIGGVMSSKSAKLDAQGKFQEFLHGATFGFIGPAQEDFAKMMDQVIAGGMPRIKKHNLLAQLSQIVPFAGPAAAGKTQFSVGRAAIDESHLNKQSKDILKKVFNMAQRARQIVGAPVRLRVGEIGIAATRRAVHNLGVGFDALRRNTAVSTGQIAKTVDRNFRNIRESMGIHSRSGERALARNMSLAARAITDSLHHGWVSADQFLKSIRHSFAVNSRGSARVAKSNFDTAARAIHDAVSSGQVSADKGLREINRLFRSYLGRFGLHGAAATFYLRSGARGTGFLPGHSGLHPGHNQRGGYISEGAPSGDSVPSLLEKGEGVINRRAVEALGGPAAIHAINRRYPRFQTGGVIPRQVVGGPNVAERAMDQRALDTTRHRANAILTEARRRAQASAVGGEILGKGSLRMYAFPLPQFGSEGRVDRGQDMEASRPHATTVAVGHGKVVNAGIGFPGIQIRLSRGPLKGNTAFYGHNNAVFTKVGANVRPGQPVGQTGNPIGGGGPTHTEIGFMQGYGSQSGHWTGPGSAGGMLMHNLLHRIAPGRIGAAARMARGGVVGRHSDLLAGLNRRFPRHSLGGASGHYQMDSRQVRAVAEAAGFSPARALQFDQIARGESTRYPGVVSGDGGWGLWQITPSAWPANGSDMKHMRALGGLGAMLNPIRNAKMARFMFGESGLRPWHGTAYLQPLHKHVRSVLGSRRTAAERAKKAPAAPVKGLKKRLRKISHYGGLSKSMAARLKDLQAQADAFGEWADRAQTLTFDDDSGQTHRGTVFGHDEAWWLDFRLQRLWSLRNYLIKAHRVLIAARKRIQKVLLPRARKHLKMLRKHPVVNRDRIKAYRDKIIPALRKRYGDIGSTDTDLLSTLSDVQGAGSSMKMPGAGLLSMPPIGQLGGSIFDTQVRLRELGKKTTATDTATPERLQSIIDLLREQLQQANLGKAVSEGAFQVFRDMPSFQTAPGQWHTVPGPYNQPMAAVVHGGERIGRPGDTSVQVYVHPGGAGADVKVNGEWVRAEVRKVLRSEVSRVGRTPARAGT